MVCFGYVLDTLRLLSSVPSSTSIPSEPLAIHHQGSEVKSRTEALSCRVNCNHGAGNYPCEPDERQILGDDRDHRVLSQRSEA